MATPDAPVRPAYQRPPKRILILIGLPMVTWIGWILYQVWRIGGHILDFFIWVAPWIARVFLWIRVAALVLGAFAALAWLGWVCYRLVVALTR